MSRVILKISGEALKKGNALVSPEELKMILETIKILKNNNHLVSIVVGGGNIFRGRNHEDMEVLTRDTIGMLGTVINALYIKDYLIKNGISSLVTTPFEFPNLLSDYSEEELNKFYEDGNVIIFGGGIGLSGYSTDSGVVKALNILNTDLIIKMTNVPGVFDSDPKINKNAKMFEQLSYDDVLLNNYGIMDMYAIKECQKKKVKILVMNFLDYKYLNNYFMGKKIGTIIKE